MKLTYLGHSAVRIEVAGSDILIDPFLSGNPAATASPDEFDPDFIILTHAHGDHVGDAVAISRRSGAPIIAAVEVCDYLAKQGVETDGMNVGGKADFPFGELQFTPAKHSSSFDDGTYGGLAMGAVLTAGGLRVYHAGDTALFSDMELIGAGGLDLALLPIGSRFTMDPKAAIEAVKLLQPRRVLPIHYNTFPAITQDGAAFKAAVEAETDSDCLLLESGQSVNLTPAADGTD